ncbi:hypothetical protein [Candidatus Methanocrinis natronophilus]|uniref:Uncharacterized protein n=1 Tax=Candidatus Methanocrinis natronophilus TaxID=3033396 RepID=A0ABT5X767_9EURY|nr:hypothetical protein [Candidatus Methanocrinis natronophilus]MDF0590526.1 hypothetical protein [Candidatus Methanocrinis natronophilus]
MMRLTARVSSRVQMAGYRAIVVDLARSSGWSASSRKSPTAGLRWWPKERGLTF